MIGVDAVDDGLTIENLSAITTNSLTGVLVLLVEAKPKPATRPLLSILTVY